MVCFQGWFAFVHIALVSGVISVSILQCSRRPTVSKGIFKVDSRVGFNDGSNYLLYQHVQFIPPTVCQLLKGFIYVCITVRLGQPTYIFNWQKGWQKFGKIYFSEATHSCTCIKCGCAIKSCRSCSRFTDLC